MLRTTKNTVQYYLETREELPDTGEHGSCGYGEWHVDSSVTGCAKYEALDHATERAREHAIDHPDRQFRVVRISREVMTEPI